MFRNKKTILILIFSLLILVGAGLLYHALTTNKVSPQKDTTKKTTTVTPADESTKPPTNGSSSTAKPDVTPSTNTGMDVQKPAVDAPYPIENAHYKITQPASTQFEITLYAISNSPSQYNDYIAQLKQYKQEALSYLQGRYGDMSSFTVVWNPPNAKDL